MNGDPQASAAFPNVCVVGLGNHAKTKLLPALQANRQRIVGVVSSQAPIPGSETRTFRELNDALKALPADTLFVLASPPALHAAQVTEVLAHGYDVIVEKPAFVTSAEADKALALAESNQLVLIEAFMHRHTACYERAMATWCDRASLIARIDIDFTIPAIPDGTFRAQSDIASSGLYDMGCYGLSFLSDLGLALGSIDLTDLRTGPEGGELISLDGVIDSIDVRMHFGVAPIYANAVTFTSKNGDSTTFTPFFYGRPGVRNVTSRSDHREHCVTFEEWNAFEAMFAISRNEWLASQRRRAAQISVVTAALERLGVALQGARGR